MKYCIILEKCTYFKESVSSGIVKKDSFGADLLRELMTRPVSSANKKFLRLGDFFMSLLVENVEESLAKLSFFILVSTKFQWPSSSKINKKCSVTRSFWCEIATPLIENRHKIATQKFLKIATLLGKNRHFCITQCWRMTPLSFLLHFYATIFQKCDIFSLKKAII